MDGVPAITGVGVWTSHGGSVSTSLPLASNLPRLVSNLSVRPGVSKPEAPKPYSPEAIKLKTLKPSHTQRPCRRTP